MILEDQIKDQIKQHLTLELPKEGCGLLIVRKGKQHYIPCNNMAIGTDNFIIDPKDYLKAHTEGEIVSVIHSHPDTSEKPSQADLVACEASNLPWSIYSFKTDLWHYFQPSGYIAPLVGRIWSHGVLDCYSIVKDYYSQELKISLPDYKRSDKWWEMGDNLYLDNFKEAGFKQITLAELKPNDCMLMCIGSKVPNHAAVYLGDQYILHHFYNRLSTRDLYNDFWMKKTYGYFRYETS
jgi:proteasome lid subunit RPN8/RPN11